MKKLLSFTIAVVFAAMSFVACDKTKGNIAATGVKLNKNQLTIVVGDNETLTAIVFPAEAANKNITWTSSDPLVATVVAGKVEAIKAGTTTITVKTEDGAFADKCEVMVSAVEIAVTGVTLNESELTLVAGGQSATLTATVAPADATNQNVTWESSDPDVAIVVDDVVKPLRAGTTTITVTTDEGSFTDECEVTVNGTTIGVTGVALDKDAISFPVGKTRTLVATVLPADATNPAIVWSSSNDAIATVDENGVVTSVAIGEAVITVMTEEGQFTVECAVTVREADVYVGGYVSGTPGPYHATYWKNGVQTTVCNTSNSYINGLYVTDDGDIYAAGFESNGLKPYAVVWKNGVAQKLGSDGDLPSVANAVFVAGDDVYVVGYEHESRPDDMITDIQLAMLWKNGEPIKLSDQYSEARSIYVYGDDVYIVGRNSYNVHNASFATIWKNGEITQLEASPSAAFGVYVLNNDVHIAGVQNTQFQFALYWKNGQVTRLQDSPSAAASIFVSEQGDVYVGGTDGQSMSARIWKNGTPRQLSTSMYTAVNAVYGLGSDIYAGGQVGFQMTSGAGYWKNDDPTPVKWGPPGTNAYGLFVN